jgi:hypothetical protein
MIAARVAATMRRAQSGAQHLPVPDAELEHRHVLRAARDTNAA